MSQTDFSIDPRSKYGDADWEGDDFTTFVDALNRGVAVRSDSIPGESGAPADLSLDALAISELRAKLANYR